MNTITAAKFLGITRWSISIERLRDSNPKRTGLYEGGVDGETIDVFTKLTPDDSRFVQFLYYKALIALKPKVGDAIRVVAYRKHS